MKPRQNPGRKLRRGLIAVVLAVVAAFFVCVGHTLTAQASTYQDAMESDDGWITPVGHTYSTLGVVTGTYECDFEIKALEGTLTEYKEDMTVTREGRKRITTYTYTAGDYFFDVNDPYGNLDTLYILTDKPILIRNRSGVETANDSIQIGYFNKEHATKADVNGVMMDYTKVKANLILCGVNIDCGLPNDGSASDVVYQPRSPIQIMLKTVAGSSDPYESTSSDYEVGGGCSLSIILPDGVENNLTSQNRFWPALRCGETTELSIDDEVPNVDVNGDTIQLQDGKIVGDHTVQKWSTGELIEVHDGDLASALDSTNPGKLTCIQGKQEADIIKTDNSIIGNVTVGWGASSVAAAIGGASNESGGVMTFNGGIITADHAHSVKDYSANGADANGAGAGIGGGQKGDGGIITINGGKIYAYGTYHGAGIGGGQGGMGDSEFLNYSAQLSNNATSLNWNDITSTSQVTNYKFERKYDIKGIGLVPVKRMYGEGTYAAEIENSFLENAVFCRGYGGNITINGGYALSVGGSHSAAFGDGCMLLYIDGQSPHYGDTTLIRDAGGNTLAASDHSNTNKTYTVNVTGGTALAISKNTDIYVGVPYWVFCDLGCVKGDVVVSGGSLRAENFTSFFYGGTDSSSTGSRGHAYSSKTSAVDSDSDDEVFMCYISLAYLFPDGTEDMTAQLKSFQMYINGVPVEYGSPSYTDENGLLYLWLPQVSTGSEISVDLELYKNDGSGETYDTTTFYIKEVSEGAYLKQYEDFSIDKDQISEEDQKKLTKRYDGEAFGDGSYKDETVEPIFEWVVTTNDLKGVQVDNPEGEYLSDKTKLFIAHVQALKNIGPDANPVWVPDTEKDQVSFANMKDVGKYRLTVESSQYADTDGFKESFWGHRAIYDYAEITPADTQTSVKVTASDGSALTGVVDPSDNLKFSVTVTPHHGNAASEAEGIEAHDPEATTCEAPKGKVQLYLTDADGNKAELGDPIDLEAAIASTDTDGNVTYETDDSDYMYSTATLTTKLSSYTKALLAKGFTISAEYTCGNGNYTTSSGDAKIEPSATLTIAKTLSAADGATLPTNASNERFEVLLSNLTKPDTSEDAIAGARVDVKTGTYAFRVVKTNLLGLEEVVTTDSGNKYQGTVQVSIDKKYGSQIIYVGVTGDGSTVKTEDSYTNEGGAFYLAPDEKVVIEYLPASVTYSVSEYLDTGQASEGYYLSEITYVDQGDDASGDETSIKGYNSDWTLKTGTLAEGKTTPVTVKNAYKTVTLDDSQVKYLTVVKQLAGGRTWGNGETFQFTLECRDNAPMPAASNDVTLDTTSKVATLTVKGNAGSTSGTGNFGNITFTKAGTYTYVINEVEPTDGSDGKDAKLAYSKEAYRVTVVVENETDDYGNYKGLKVANVTRTKTRDADGNLSLTLNVTKNTSEWGEVTDWSTYPNIKYAYKNSYFYSFKNSSDEEIDTATLAPETDNYFDEVTNTASLDDVTITKPGEYSYTLTETANVWIAPDEEGGKYTESSYETVYDIVLTVKEDENGVLQTASVSKKFRNTTRQVWVEDESGNRTQQTATSDDGTLSFYGTGAAAASATFTNTKVEDIAVTEDSTIGITAKKTLEGGRSTGILDGEFSVDLTGVDYGSSTTSDEAIAKLNLGKDDDNKDITVKSIDFGAGEASGTNSIATTTNVLEGATYSYADRDKVYAYVVTEHVPDEATDPDRSGLGNKTYGEADATEKAEAGWKYEGVTYDSSAKKYLYVKVCYDATNGLYLELYTTDPASSGAVAVATTNGSTHVAESTLDFKNTYALDETDKIDLATSEADQVKKAIENGAYWDGDETFSFTLSKVSYQEVNAEGEGTGEVSDTEGPDDAHPSGYDKMPMPAAKKRTVTVSSSELKESSSSTVDVHFDKVAFSKPGIYTYQIKENVPAEAKNNVLNGVTYDTHTVTVTVTVTEGTKTVGDVEVPNGKLTASIAYDGDTTFTNTYKATPISLADAGISTTIYKTLNGHDIDNSKPFTFKVENIKPEEGNYALLDGFQTITVSYPETTSTGVIADSDGVQQTAAENVLSSIKFGTDETNRDYCFKISEQAGSDTGYSYDSNYYLLTVYPLDNGDGTMSLEGRVTKYDADGKEVGDFTNLSYDLYIKDGSLVQKGTTGATKLDDAGYTDGFAFTNTYTATGDLSSGNGYGRLYGIKNLAGRAQKAGEFEFEVYDTATTNRVTYTSIDGKSTGKVTTDAGDGNDAVISFPAFTFTTKQATDSDFDETQISLPFAVSQRRATKTTVDGKTVYIFKWTVAEKTSGFAAKGISVKDGTASSVDITVLVTDNGNGTLSAVACRRNDNGTYEVPGEFAVGYSLLSSAPLQFKNVYSASQTFSSAVTLDITKKLTGRSMLAGDFTLLITPEATTNAEDDSLSTTALDAAQRVDSTRTTADAFSLASPAGTAGTAKTVDLGSFGNLTFTKADSGKTFTYTVSEDLMGTTASSDGTVHTKDGVTYSEASYTLKITPVDNGKGGMSITTVVTDKDGNAYGNGTYEWTSGTPATITLPFENSYEASGYTDEGTLAGKKHVVDEDGNELTPDTTGSSYLTSFKDYSGFTFRLEGYNDATKTAIKNGWVTLHHSSEIGLQDKSGTSPYWHVNANADSAEFNFGQMKFTRTGDYEFVMYESVSKSGSEWTKTGEKKLIKVSVTDEGTTSTGAPNGTLKAAITSITSIASSVSTTEATWNKASASWHTGNTRNDLQFVNMYQVTPTKYNGEALEIEKIVTGGDQVAGERFSFTMTAATGDAETSGTGVSTADAVTKGYVLDKDGKAFDDATNKISDYLKVSTTKDLTTANGGKETLKFSGLTFTKAGTYTFYVKETNTAPNEQWTYASHTYVVKLRVTDDAGKLSVSQDKTGLTDDQLRKSFTNAYGDSTDYGQQGGLRVTKALDGATLNEGDFTFKITPADPASKAKLAAANNESDEGGSKVNADGSVTFTNRKEDTATGKSENKRLLGLQFTEEDKGDTYTYYVSEVVDDNATNPNVNGGNTKYSAADDTEKATAGWTYNGYTYDVETATVEITVPNDVRDAAVTATDENGEKYTVFKTHTIYTVTKVTKGGATKTYSSKEAVTAAVVDFSNSYEATGSMGATGATAIDAYKLLTGRDLTNADADELEFTVRNVLNSDSSTSANVVSTGTISKKADASLGNVFGGLVGLDLTYGDDTVVAEDGDEAKISFSPIVYTTLNSDTESEAFEAFKTEAKKTYGENVTVVSLTHDASTKKSSTSTATIARHYTGEDAQGKLTDYWVYDYSITENATLNSSTNKLETPIDNVYGTAGKVSYEVAVTITDSHDGTLSVKVTQSGVTPKLVFENYYEPESSDEFSLKVQKTVTGTESTSQTFSYLVAPADDATTKALEAGSITGLGKYDSDGDGTVDTWGQKLTTTGSLAGDTAMSFDFTSALVFTEATAENSPYKFKITEDTTKPNEAWTMDSHEATLEVSVADENGKLVPTATYSNSAASSEADRTVTTAAAFTNTYATSYDYAANGGLTVSKKVSGTAQTAGKFTFELTPVGDNAKTLLDSSDAATFQNKGGSAGAVVATDLPSVWSKVKFTNADAEAGKSYEFTIREQINPNATNSKVASLAGMKYSQATTEAQKTAAGWTYEGYEYDAALYKVTLTPVDDGNGKLTVNTVITKTVDNRSEAYYDSTTAGSGSPAITFENSYSASTTLGAAIDANIYKTLNGHDIDGNTGEFTFTVSCGGLDESTFKRLLDLGTPSMASDGRWYMTTSISSGTADVKNIVSSAFTDMTFTQDDAGKTYSFTIDEDEPTGAAKKSFVTYDDSTYALEVTVVDNGNGTLGLKGTVKHGSDSTSFSKNVSGATDATYTEGFAFTNTYKAEGTLAANTLKIEKQLAGRAWASGDSFEFKIEAVTEGAPLPSSETVTISNSTAFVDGSTTTKTGAFGAINYTKPGTYEYTVSEVAGSDETMSYTTVSYTATVQVDDNNNGTLTAYVASITGGQVKWTRSDTDTTPAAMYFLNSSAQKTAEVTANASDANDVQVGSVITYTVSFIANNSGYNHNLEVVDVIPDGLEYVESSRKQTLRGEPITSGVKFDATTPTEGENAGKTVLTWTFENVAAYSTGTVSFEARVTEKALQVKDGTITNTATTQVDTGHDPVVKTTTAENTLETGSLAIAKTVVLKGGAAAGDADDFTFTVKATDAAGNALTGEYAVSGAKESSIDFDDKGEGTITLEDVSSTAKATISGLPEGTKYTVTETSPSAKWTTTSTGASGAVAAGTLKTASFTNTYTPDSVTLTGSTDLTVSKTLEGRNGLSNETYTIEMAKTSYNNETSDEALAAMPLPGGETGTTVDVVESMKGATEGEAVESAFGDMSFSQTGTYVYTIHEASGTATTGMTYSKASYRLTVEVVADGSGLKIKSSTLQQMTDGGGTDVSATSEAKSTGSFLLFFSGPTAAFTNSYAPVESTKTVVSSADTTKDLTGEMTGAGETVVYKIDWTSNALDAQGVAAAGIVTVADTLPAGMSYVSAVDGDGDGLTGTVTKDDATGRQTVTFSLDLQEPAADNSPATGTIYLTAEVSDSNTASAFENTAQVNSVDTTTAKLTAPVKATSTESAGIGDTIDYTVTFTNGSSSERTYTVTDELASYLSYSDDSAALADGSEGKLGTVGCASNTLTANVTLGAGKTATLQFSATLVGMPASGKATNHATVAVSGEATGHKTNTVSTDVATNSLKVTKAVTNTSTVPDVEFPITISLFGQDGKTTLAGSYSYQVYNSAGGKLTGDGKSGTISGGSGTVNVKRDQYVVVSGLPVGAVAAASEAPESIPSGFANANATAEELTATIAANAQASITVKNSYKSTGSLGGEGSAAIEAKKVLTGGKSMDAGDYTFSITPKRFTSTTSEDERSGGSLFSISGSNAAAAYIATDGNASAAISFDPVSFSTQTYEELGSESSVVSLPDSVSYGYAELMTSGTYAGAYHFVLTVAEDTSDLPAGVSAEGTTSYDVDLYVADNGEGGLTATVEYPEGFEDGLVFTNAYNMETTYGNVMRVVGNKTLSGRAILSTDEFSFDVTADTDAAAAKLSATAKANDILTYATNAGTGTGYTVQSDALRDAFAAMSFSTADAGKIFTYLVVEHQPEGAEGNVYNGVTYDTTSYTIAISVSDDLLGKLTVKTLVSKTADGTTTYLTSSTENVSTWSADKPNVSASDPAGYSYAWTSGGSTTSAVLEFQNSYSASGTLEGALSGTKVVDGPYGGDKSGFSFRIAGYNDAARAALSASPAKITLSHGSNSGLDQGNTYFAVTSAADGTFDFGDMTFTEPGTYQFDVWESRGKTVGNEDAAGWTNSTEHKIVTVEVANASGKANGQLTATLKSIVGYKTSDISAGNESGVDSLTFTNTYTQVASAATAIEFNKVVTGITSGDIDVPSFSFSLTPADDATTAAVAEGAIRDASGNAFTGELSLTKTIASSEFTSANNHTVRAAFDGLTFTKAGTYSFNVTETSTAGDEHWSYDNTPHTVKVRVTDVNSQLTAGVENDVTITNSYGSSTSYSLQGGLQVVKELSGATLKAGDFNFTIKATEGIAASSSNVGTTEAAARLKEANEALTGTDKGVIAADGTVVFPNRAASDDGKAYMSRLSTLQFTSADLDKTFSYQIVELPSSYDYDAKQAGEAVGGVSYDGSAYTVEITVKTSGSHLYTVTVVEKDGAKVGEYSSENGRVTPQLVFSNNYEAQAELGGSGSGVTQIKATKTLEGLDLTSEAAAKMKFVVSAASGQVATGSLTNLSGNTADVSFGRIVYTTAEKGSEEYTALKAENADATVVSLPAAVAAGDAVKMTDFATGSTAVDGWRFNYTVREVTTSESNLAIDGLAGVSGKPGSVMFDINVEVIDNHDGTMSVEVSYPKAEDGTALTSLSFVNVYEAGASDGVSIQAQKSITGRSVTTQSFGITLAASDDDAKTSGLGISTKAALEAGETYVTGMPGTAQTRSTTGEIAEGAPQTVFFSPLTFKKVGVYHFTVSEVVPEDAVDGVYQGFTYDTHVCNVTVAVTDDGSGKLSASVKYGDDETAKAAAFTNDYDAGYDYAAEGGMSVGKTVTGGAAEAGAFKYYVEAESDAAAALAGIGMDESIDRKPKRVELTFGEDIAAGGTLSVDWATTFAEQLKFTPANASGSYVYTVYEEIPAGATNTIDGKTYTFDDLGTDTASRVLKKTSGWTYNGWTYDSTIYRVTLTPADDGKGTISVATKIEVVSLDGNTTVYDSATAAAGENPQVVFTNTYGASATLGSFENLDATIYKTLTGEDIDATDGFTFAVSTVADAEGYATETECAAKLPYSSEASDGTHYLLANITEGGADEQHVVDASILSSITFTQDDVGKTFRFRITETDSEGNALTAADAAWYGIEFDESSYLLSVTPVNNGDSTLGLTGSVEKSDGAVSTFSVGVADEDDVAYEGGFAFTNKFVGTEDPVNLQVEKTVSGRDWAEDESFSFELEAGSYTNASGEAGDAVGVPMPSDYGGSDTLAIAKGDGNSATGSFGGIYYGAAGSYSYTISEVSDENSDLVFSTDVYDVTVEVVADAATGELSVASVTYALNGEAASVASFTNTASEPEGSLGYVEMDITNTLSGRAQADSSYKYTVTPKDGVNTTADETKTKLGLVTDADSYVMGEAEDGEACDAVTLVPAGVVFSADDAGKTYVFELKQTTAPTPLASSNGGYGYTNYTDACTVEIKVWNSSGSLVIDTYVDGMLEARITESSGGATVLSIDPVVSPQVITLPFENYYTAKGTVKVEATKTLLDGSVPGEGEFSFGLVRQKDASTGTPLVATASNGADGKVELVGDFTLAEVKQAVADGWATYSEENGSYTLSLVAHEDTSSLSGYTAVASSFTVLVKAVDNGDGTLAMTQLGDAPTFVNQKASATSVSDELLGTKKIDVEDGVTVSLAGFEFTVKALDGAPEPEHATATSDAAGNIDFGTIEFTKAGTYRYLVTEKEQAEGSTNGIVNDENATRLVTFTVEKDAAGMLMVSSVSSVIPATDGADESADTGAANGACFSFTNSYEPAAAKLCIEATKTLTGGRATALQADEFEFQFVDAETGAVAATATNDADGKVEFKMTYSEVGTHIYTLREVAGSDSTISYDDAEYRVVVTVSDPGTGQLTAQYAVEDATGLPAGATFENVYTAPVDPTPTPTPDPDPDEPDTPDTPDNPDTPDTPDTPDNPTDTPTEPTNPTTPSNPSTPGNGTTPTDGGTTIPKVGDPGAAAPALLAALGFATLRLSRRRRKR